MKIKHNAIKSIRYRLFFTISTIIILIIVFLIIVDNLIFGEFYMFNKRKELKEVYKIVNSYYKNPENIDLESELEQIAVKNNFEISIKDGDNINVYSSNKDFFSNLGIINEMTIRPRNESEETIEENEKMTIKKIQDNRNGISYVVLLARLDNGYQLYARVPIVAINESVKISNKFLYMVAGVTIIISAIIVSYVSRKFTDPILELDNIAKKMSKLDFSQKYKITSEGDEINTLGNSINLMSEKLEKTIKQLRETNVELEKDIEEKSKIDEMRKSFISDVSHELKTPIALIQGYSEGLLENVNSDEESRKFYAEVILDETNKMDKLVKQLLELMKLEYGKMNFNNSEFNIVELEKEVVRKSGVMLEEKDVKIEFVGPEEINVLADDFYIEQVISNYLTNAIKNVKKINKEKIIRIENDVNLEKGKVRIKVFNTGDNIPKEYIDKIWTRFYKIDESRNRNDGGTGIGLSFVKAVMNNYKNDYGVINTDTGVEFYFELKLSL